MTCPTCGAALEAGAATCTACGASLPAGPVVLPRTSLSKRALRPVVGDRTLPPVGEAEVLAGRYRLERKLGEGGMGTVFLAHDQELDRQVAVKLLAASLLHDPEVQERFEREARLTAKLDHPNIVPIYDVGRHEGRPFFVMKLLTGDSLAALLHAKGGLPATETLRLLKQLAAGLDYLHARGLIHRDVKAGNVMVSADGHVTLLDFGILRHTQAPTGLTRAGMVMGTPHYMAPEQALGLADVDHRVDLYALGVVLFECLSGTLPFEASTELGLIQLQAHAPTPDIRERAPWVPRPVADVVARALAKKPEARFATGAELVAALEAAYQTASSTPTDPQVATVLPPLARPLAPTPSWDTVQTDTGAMVRAVRSPLRPLLAVGALLAGAGLAAALWLWPSPEPSGPAVAPPAPLAVGQLPAGHDAGADERPEDAGSAPLAVAIDADAGEDLSDGDAGPAGLAALEVPDAGPAPEDAGAPPALAVVEPQGEPVAERKPPAPLRKGRVDVLTTLDGEPYWAQVSLDGELRGRTPLRLELPAGRYQLRLERSGFRTHSRWVRVAAGRAQVVRLELEPAR